jgi:hypothetical protein
MEKEFGKRAKSRVFDLLENRVEIDARGAFLSPRKNNLLWQYFETPVQDTALFVKALAHDRRESDLLGKSLRWLLRSRAKDGSWGTTNATLVTIDALTEYLAWKRETESNFELGIFLNDFQWANQEYTPATILTQDALTIPIVEEAPDPASKLEFGVLNTLSFQRTKKNDLANTFYYDLSLRYYLPIETIPPRDQGFAVTRNFYGLEDSKMKNPLASAKVGDVIRGHLEIIVPESRNFVAVEDFIPAGMELVNFNLSTEDRALLENNFPNEDGRLQENNNRSQKNRGGFRGDSEYYWEGDSYDYEDVSRNVQISPTVTEYRDDRLFLFVEHLGPGVYEFDYYARALAPGEYHHLPAVVSEMYLPENFGRTRGDWFGVKE